LRSWRQESCRGRSCRSWRRRVEVDRVLEIETRRRRRHAGQRCVLARNVEIPRILHCECISRGHRKCEKGGPEPDPRDIFECASFHSASPPELALRAAAMLNRKTGLNNPSAALSAGHSSHFTKPFDPVVRRPTALEARNLRYRRQSLRSRRRERISPTSTFYLPMYSITSRSAAGETLIFPA
jgi:hypothetical protein